MRQLCFDHGILVGEIASTDLRNRVGGVSEELVLLAEDNHSNLRACQDTQLMRLLKKTRLALCKSLPAEAC